MTRLLTRFFSCSQVVPTPRAVRNAVVICALALTGLAAHAQVTTGDILGTVTDPSGAVVSGATVRVENSGTHEIRTAATRDSGGYVFTALQPGTYVVTVSSPNFKAYKATEVVLLASDRVRLDARLQVGGADQEVQVTAEASSLQTDSTTVGNTITEKTLLDAPLNGRNYIQLVQLQAGVNSGSTSSLASGNNATDRRLPSGVSANGQQEIYNNNLVDGLDNNERATGIVILRPSIEAIGEVRTDINLYNAEVGRSGGAVINVITKSGTNQFHGSAYEFFRNDITDSRNFFIAPDLHKPELRQNQFGGSLGGPIFKDKTFFFLDYEGLRRIDGTNTVYYSTVPTAAEQQTPGYLGDIINPFTRAPVANVPTASIDPTSLAYFKTYPLPNILGAAAGQPNFIYNPNATLNQNIGDVRIDHHFSAKDTLFARYSYNRAEAFTPAEFPYVNGIASSGNLQGTGGNNEYIHNGQLSYTHIFTPSLLMQLNAGYTLFNDFVTTVNQGQNYNTGGAFNIPNANQCILPICSGLAAVFPIGYGPLGDSLVAPSFLTDHNTQFEGSLTYTRGRHTFKVGGALIRRNFTFEGNIYPKGIAEFLPTVVLPSAANPAGVYQPTLQHMFLGAPYISVRTLFNVKPYDRLWESSGYFQDDWRATDHLTLNLGIRYDVFTKPNQKGNTFSNFNLSTLSIVQNANGGINNNYKNVSPRFGFDADLGHGRVLRGGFGLTFFPGASNSSLVLTNPGVGFSSGNVLNFTPLSVTGVPADVASSTATSALAGSVISEPSNFPDSYFEQFNLLAQQDYRGTVFTIGYVGQLGRHLINQIPNADIPAPNGPYPGNVAAPPPALVYAAQLPKVTTINYYGAFGASSYNSLQISADRRIARGLTANVNYTLSHNLDDTIEVFDGDTQSIYGFGDLPSQISTYDYGNSDLDLRSRFAGYFSYDLPTFGNSSHLLRAMLGGFRFNGIGFWQTGSPFTVTSQVANANSLASINLPTVTIDRPSLVHAPTVSGAVGSAPGVSYFDITAFGEQPYGTVGNERRNQLYGPHLRRGDLSLFKTIPIHDNIKLELRAECIDFTNTPNFSKPGTNITGEVPVNGVATPTNAGGFGQVTSTLFGFVGRQFQFAGRFSF